MHHKPQYIQINLFNSDHLSLNAVKLYQQQNSPHLHV